ncbi:hypothetical protein GCM10009590_22970 [Brachybacterium alimentarium]
MGDLVEADAGVLQGDLQGGDRSVEMRAGGDLGDHSSELGVLGRAGGEALAQQDALGDEAEAGLVAGGLDPQDDRSDGTGHRRSDIGFE